MFYQYNETSMTGLQMRILGCLIAFVVGLSLASEEATTCDTMFCAMGQECVMKRSKATCECIQRCRDPVAPVCGRSGGRRKTYKNECEMFKEACEMKDEQTIELLAMTSCEEDEKNLRKMSEEIEKDSTKDKPVVCMEKDRDNMRKAVITWLSTNLTLEGDHRSYKGLLFTYFDKYDLNKDSMLDTYEFMEMIGLEDKLSKLLSLDSHASLISKGLCMAELIAISDYDSDYKLTFEEFCKCFDPMFEPPKEKCTLEGRDFDDGEDIPQDCNTCKCACGNWVCTLHNCDANSSKVRLLKEMPLDTMSS